MADSVELKRRREDEFPFEEVELDTSPTAKRLREDFFLEILDGEDDDVDADDQDNIASVMKSLEEEIALPSVSPPQPPPSVAPADQPDLGYLFEASDDELGLPPTVPSSSDDGVANAEAVSAGNPDVGVDQGVGFGQIWGFDDEISGYDAFDLGTRPDERTGVVVAAGDDGDAFDGGMFDFGDVICGSSDFAEFSWRSESLPAV